MHNQNNYLSGVKCVVNSCKYYADGNHCTAQKIEIQPQNAHNTQETDCATFKPNNNMR